MIKWKLLAVPLNYTSSELIKVYSAEREANTKAVGGLKNCVSVENKR